MAESLKMRRDDSVTARGIDDTAAKVLVGLEPLGTDVLVEGEIRQLSTTEMVVAAASMLATGTRAFFVIAVGSGAPVVGLVEIVDQRVLVEDVTVELHARFISMSEANTARVAALLSPGQ